MNFFTFNCANVIIVSSSVIELHFCKMSTVPGPTKGVFWVWKKCCSNECPQRWEEKTQGLVHVRLAVIYLMIRWLPTIIQSLNFRRFGIFRIFHFTVINITLPTWTNITLPIQWSSFPALTLKIVDNHQLHQFFQKKDIRWSIILMVLRITIIKDWYETEKMSNIKH